MTEDGRRDSALAELALAAEELRAADTLLQAGMPRVALTRAYYAVFHSARAMLFSSGFEPRTHGGTAHLFNLHIVKEGRVGPEASRILARLQKFREEADYAQAFVVDDAGAREEIDAARRLCDELRRDMEG